MLKAIIVLHLDLVYDGMCGWSYYYCGARACDCTLIEASYLVNLGSINAYSVYEIELSLLDDPRGPLQASSTPQSSKFACYIFNTLFTKPLEVYHSSINAAILLQPIFDRYDGDDAGADECLQRRHKLSRVGLCPGRYHSCVSSYYSPARLHTVYRCVSQDNQVKKGEGKRQGDWHAR